MKNKQNPFFSIAIPTRNRATILQSVLRSCTAQTFENFEIIISKEYKFIKYSRNEKNLDYDLNLVYAIEKLSDSTNFLDKLNPLFTFENCAVYIKYFITITPKEQFNASESSSLYRHPDLQSR